MSFANYKVCPSCSYNGMEQWAYDNELEYQFCPMCGYFYDYVKDEECSGFGAYHMFLTNDKLTVCRISHGSLGNTLQERVEQIPDLLQQASAHKERNELLKVIITKPIVNENLKSKWHNIILYEKDKGDVEPIVDMLDCYREDFDRMKPVFDKLDS